MKVPLLLGYNDEKPLHDRKCMFDNDLNTWYSLYKLWGYCEIKLKNNKAISIHNYTVVCGINWGIKADYPKMWGISGYDGSKYVNVSVVVESNLKTAGSRNTFCLEQPSPFFSSIRIHCIGKSYDNNNLLAIASFDVFGEIGQLKDNHINKVYIITTKIATSAISVFFLLN